MKNLYQELLLDHYKNPRNRGELENPDFKTKKYHPSCGDIISFSGIMQDGTLTALKFMGSGCVLSQGTASFLTEYAVGKTSKELLKLDKEGLQTLLGISLGLLRMACILLPLQALQDGIRTLKQN